LGGEPYGHFVSCDISQTKILRVEFPGVLPAFSQFTEMAPYKCRISPRAVVARSPLLRLLLHPRPSSFPGQIRRTLPLCVVRALGASCAPGRIRCRGVAVGRAGRVRSGPVWLGVLWFGSVRIFACVAAFSGCLLPDRDFPICLRVQYWRTGAMYGVSP